MNVNMFIVGRETTSLHRKLVRVDPGSLGTAGSWGIPHRISGDPHQGCAPQEVQVSSDMQSQISEGIVELLSKGAIEETQPDPQSFISQIFLVEKKDWGFRPIINLKSLNHHVRTEHFKMESLHLLPFLIQQEDWMVKLDLKNAYLQVPIHLCQYHLLQYQWQRKTYQFKCLPI